MPPRLVRHLLKQLLERTLFSLGGLVLVALVGQGLRLLGELTALSPDTPTGLGLILLLVPMLAPVLLPAAFLMGCLSLLVRMASTGELLGLQAMGIAPFQQTKLLFFAGLPMALLSLLAGIYAEPAARSTARGLLQELVFQQALRPLEPGEVRNLEPAFSAMRSEDGGLTLLLESSGALRILTREARWTRADGPTGSGNILLQATAGTLSHLELVPPGRSDFTHGQFSSLRLVLPPLETASRRELLELTWRELNGRIRAAEASGLRAGPERLMRAKRLAYPAACLAFALIVVPLVPARVRLPSSRAYLLGALVLVVYYLAVRILDARSVRQDTQTELWIWAPNLVLASVGLGLSWLHSRRIP